MVARSGLSLALRSTLAGLGVIAFFAFGAPTVAAQDVEAAPQDLTDAQEIDSTDECVGTITASLAAESLPSGEWSAHGDCLTGDRFYEFVEGPLLAKAAVADVVYTDGHSGRIAAGILTLGNGLGLGIVGVEDAATGVIKWSAVLDDFHAEGDSVSVAGEGVAVFPVEKATVSAQLTGTGTDVKPFLDGYEAEEFEDPESAADVAHESGSSDDVTGQDGGTGSSGQPTDGFEGTSTDTSVPSRSDSDSDGVGAASDGHDRSGARTDDQGSRSGSTSSGSPVTTTPGVDYGIIEAPKNSDVDA